MKFYMDRPRSATVKGNDDPDLDGTFEAVVGGFVAKQA
jgi:hypothetical protein